MKSIRYVALVLVTATAPAWAQQMSLLGQTADRSAIAVPPGTYTAADTGRQGSPITLSLSAIPADAALRTASPDTLVRREQPAEMIATVRLDSRDRHNGAPIEVREDALGNSIALMPGTSGQLRTRVGANVTAYVHTSAKASEWYQLRVVVPPKSPRRYYDDAHETFFDLELTRNSYEGWFPFVRNDVVGQRRDVTFEQTKHGLARVTTIVTLYGF